MLNGIGKINWKQNQMHPSEVRIDVRFTAKEEISFLLNADMVNHIFQKRDDMIEIHFRFEKSDQPEVCKVDFSKIKPVKPNGTLLKQKMTLPKIDGENSEKETKENEKIGIYSIFHPDSNRWLTDRGWGYIRNYFNIVPERLAGNSLSVSIAPKDAVDSGAAWGVKNIKWQDSSSTVSVPKGNCVVEFKPLEGWIAPKARQVHIQEGSDKTISAEYTVGRPKLMRQEPLNLLFIFIIAFSLSVVLYYLGKPIGPGTLSAALSPPEVVSQGAQWRIENGNWQTGNGMIELEPGEYALEFKPVDGWQPPPQQQISLKEGQVAQIDAAYNKVPIETAMSEEMSSEDVQRKVESESRQPDSGDSLPLNSNNRQEAAPNSESTVSKESQQKPSRVTTEKRSVTVQITPPEAVQAGAGWKLEGPGEWKATGKKISGLLNIPYTIIFKTVEGWEKPRHLELADHGPAVVVREARYKKVSKNVGE